MANHTGMAGDGKTSIVVFVKRTLAKFQKDDVPEIAAGVAYHAIFAIPPLIAFVIALAALLNQVANVPVADRLIQLINDNAPDQTRQLLLELVDGAIKQVSGGAALFGVLLTASIALWSGSNGVATVMKACNRAYDVSEDRGFLKIKLISIGLTVVVGVLVILAFVMLVFGRPIGDAITSRVGLDGAFNTVWSVVQIVGPILFIMLVLALLFNFAPNVKQTFRLISPGSIVSTVLWIVVLFGFRYYAMLANPGSAYGTVGSVVVLMFFLYLSAIIFITGAVVNAVAAGRGAPVVTADAASAGLAVQQPDRQPVADGQARTEGEAIPLTAPLSAGPGRPATKQPRKPGVLTRIVTGVATFTVGVLLARMARSRERRRK